MLKRLFDARPARAASIGGVMNSNEGQQQDLAAYDFTASGNVAVIVVKGILTSGTMRTMTRVAADLVGKHRLNAYMLVLTRAMVLVDEVRLLAAVSQAAATLDGPKVPAAFVARADDLALWTRHCILMTEQGFLRFASSQQEHAMAWAQRMALVHQAWSELEVKQGPGCASASCQAPAPEGPAYRARPASRRKPSQAPSRQH